MADENERSPEQDPGRGRSSWSRRYPPLLTIGIVLFLVLAIMPSSLTLPQSNPSTVLEYAPVPPEDENPPPPQQGNTSSLGLGSSSTITEEAAPPTPPPGEPTGAVTGNPTVYDCVGGQQTSDPIAPPCSPFFEGENFGSTYQGVTGSEVRVLIYIDGSQNENSGTATYFGEEAPVQGTYCDLWVQDSPEKCHNDTGQDHLFVRATRALQRYFNARFQTYKRRLHFFIYWSGATSQSERRADSADNVAEVDPFAVIDQATFRGNNDAYTDAMARRGVMVFSSLQGQPRGFYQKYEPLVWGFPPDIEQRVDHYVEYVCKKVEPYPVSHSGPGIEHGQERRYAFMYTTDPAWPDLERFRKLAIPALKERCGIDPEVTVTYPFNGYVIDTGGDPAYARLNVAEMRQHDVTTILWLGGVEGKTGQAADEQRYYPEIVHAGDTFMESQTNGALQNQNFWANAWIVTPVARFDTLNRTQGAQAYYEAEPNGTEDDAFAASLFYRDMFMVATGVQVSGPRLHPAQVDTGFHNIPRVSSTSPYVPAFFFVPGGYTGVQDATHMWWDPSGQDTEGTFRNGCYRMVDPTPENSNNGDGGLRYLLGEWPEGDTVFVNGAADPCNRYDVGARGVFRFPGLEE